MQQDAFSGGLDGGGGISFMDLFGGEESSLNLQLMEEEATNHVLRSTSSEASLEKKKNNHNPNNNNSIPKSNHHLYPPTKSKNDVIHRNNNNNGSSGNEINKMSNHLSNNSQSKHSEKKMQKKNENFQNLEKSKPLKEAASNLSIVDLLFGNVGSSTLSAGSQTNSNFIEEENLAKSKEASFPHQRKSNERNISEQTLQKSHQQLHLSQHSHMDTQSSSSDEDEEDDSSNETQLFKSIEQKKDKVIQKSKTTLKTNSTNLKTSSASAISLRKSSLAKEKDRNTSVPMKRKFVQTLLDKTMFEKSTLARRDHENIPNVSSSLFCMCCNQYIPITSTSKNPSKKTKISKGTHIEWSEHLESDTHKDLKEILKRFNVLCFESGTCKTRFHHFVNAYCLMNFHKVYEFACNFHKKIKRKRVIPIQNDEDETNMLVCIFIDYIVNFVYRNNFSTALSLDRQISMQDCEKSVKRFFNSMREMALSVSYLIWRDYGNFFESQTNEDFGEILSDLVHLGSDILTHLAEFGNFNPENLFLDEPFDCEALMPYHSNSEEDEEEDESSNEEEWSHEQHDLTIPSNNSSILSNEENEDSSYHDRSQYYYHSHHPYFSLFVKLYIQHFFMFKPLRVVIPEAVEEFKNVIENTELSWEEWDSFIRSKKKQFLSSCKDKTSDINSVPETQNLMDQESVSSPSPQSQNVTTQKSIEELLFGSSSQTFESLFFMPTNNNKPAPQKVAKQQGQPREKSKTLELSSNNEVHNEEEMWDLLLEEEAGWVQ
ncbi:hypothetical protein FDP41_012683 [Naegleria fowleri]|uniref:Uncharacterized protein n=1 Tax=Naegleria fowleri TaxID=5763 RepID=A0A6A5C602_NAEFO|nr:uncharacterized protein FDP41_012683 [Naegleria fowleri]KAF0980895.1 hypothetical protein FDP41_012683 [Naegleria fowleri]CAG4717220.1 unnamed protein product [Naegleria fowleri]